MINSGTHCGRPIARTHEPLLERERVAGIHHQVLDAVDVQVPTSGRDCCLWKILLLIFIIVGFIVLNIHSHCADVVTPDALQGAAGRLIREEE